MKSRLSTCLVVAVVLLLRTVPISGQALNPPYLSPFPSVERVKADIKGSDPVDTSARQMGAFWQLLQMIKTLAGPRSQSLEFTRDENNLLLRYGNAWQWYQYKDNSPPPQEQARWRKLRDSYENDPGVREELLQKSFSPEFRLAYDRATGKQPPAQPKTAQPSAAGNRPQPTKTQPSATTAGSVEPYHAHFAQGEQHRQAKNYAAAIEAYKKSISLKPTSGAYNSLGVVYQALKQHENALAAFQQAVSLKPDDATIRWNLGMNYLRMEQYENGRGALRESIRLKPDDASAHNGLGRAYSGLEDYSEAAAAFQQAIRLAPNDAYYRYNLGIAYVEMGRKEEAVQVLQALQKLDPGQAKELDNQIEVYLGDDPEELLNVGSGVWIRHQELTALRLFRRVIVLNKDPESVARAYAEIGLVYKEQQKNEKAAAAYKQAVAFFQQAIRLKPNDANIHSRLGYTYVDMGRKQDALQIYRTLLSLDKKMAQELSAEINKKASSKAAPVNDGNVGSPPATSTKRPSRPAGSGPVQPARRTTSRSSPPEAKSGNAASQPARAQENHLQGLHGERLSEADLARGVTIIVVWASWSPRSRNIVERIHPIAERWAGKARVVTVNFQEKRPAVEGFLKGKDLRAPVFLDEDGAFSKRYKVATLPGLLIIKDGQVGYRAKLPEDPNSVIAKFLE